MCQILRDCQRQRQRQSQSQSECHLLWTNDGGNDGVSRRSERNWSSSVRHDDYSLGDDARLLKQYQHCSGYRGRPLMSGAGYCHSLLDERIHEYSGDGSGDCREHCDGDHRHEKNLAVHNTLHGSLCSSYLYDHIVRDLDIRGEQVEQDIMILLAGLVKLQPDPEDMEWEGTNPTYYFSDPPPPRMLSTGVEVEANATANMEANVKAANAGVVQMVAPAGNKSVLGNQSILELGSLPMGAIRGRSRGESAGGLELTGPERMDAMITGDEETEMGGTG